ncbi:MAG: hypothetical protein H7A00_02955 [Hahellaceae bacterium]|nr:hypothetical protein [Hahellaceae bacterium]
MANKQDERYIAIARACIKAVNQIAQGTGDKEKAIESVYQAIDTAFREQNAKLLDDLANVVNTLHVIKDQTINLDDAHRKAADALAGLKSAIPKRSMH